MTHICRLAPILRTYRVSMAKGSHPHSNRNKVIFKDVYNEIKF